MTTIKTSGIIIDVEKNDYGDITGIDLFTREYGILHWFNKGILKEGCEYIFAEIFIIGKKSTETAGEILKVSIVSENFDALMSNGSLEHALIFTKTLRKMVFDGVELEDLFLLTKQAIKNFLLNFDPDVILLKALYLFCRSEGYAVDAIWWKSLSQEQQLLAKKIIQSKFDINLPEQTKFLINSLQNWILSIF